MGIDVANPELNTFHDLASANVFEMSDAEIKELIRKCQHYRAGQLNAVTPNVNSLNQQIELAQRELSARQSTRLATLSLIISTIAIVASALSVIF